MLVQSTGLMCLYGTERDEPDMTWAHVRLLFFCNEILPLVLYLFSGGKLYHRSKKYVGQKDEIEFSHNQRSALTLTSDLTMLFKVTTIPQFKLSFDSEFKNIICCKNVQKCFLILFVFLSPSIGEFWVHGEGGGGLVSDRWMNLFTEGLLQNGAWVLDQQKKLLKDDIL